MAAKKVRYIATANPIKNKAMIELRRSNASGTHNDPRDRRARSRSASLARALSYEH